MRGVNLAAVLLCTALAFGPAAAGPLWAEDAPTADQAAQPAETSSPAAAPPAREAGASDPVVAAIRTKLADAGLRKGAHADDIPALETFYRARNEGPVWTTEMGFSARGQRAIDEIHRGGDWGLEAKDFALPQAGALPESEEAQAVAEIKLGLAILKYARFARGGRFTPSEISGLLDQTPPLRDPSAVLTEIATAEGPDVYLRALHPKHEQFARLRQALLEARARDGEGTEPASESDVRRIVLNMERWRWMPEDLGSLYVWSNTPEFMLHVVKDGKTVFSDKILVGTISYATPVFSADMATIVFNPDWIAPETVLVERLWPALKKQHYGILKSHKLSVSYQGKPIDASKVDWKRVDIRRFTFIQKHGPKNVLGKAKFLYPNKHVVYMHDTLSYRRKVFKEKLRTIGYGCVRMENPQEFAQVLLAEDKDWPASKVKELWDKSVNKGVTLDNKPPVYTTYFTAVVNDEGKVSTFVDVYGLDRKPAAAMFGSSEGFPTPPPEPKQRHVSTSAAAGRPAAAASGFQRALGFLD